MYTPSLFFYSGDPLFWELWVPFHCYKVFVLCTQHIEDHLFLLNEIQFCPFKMLILKRMELLQPNWRLRPNMAAPASESPSLFEKSFLPNGSFKKSRNLSLTGL